MSKSIDVTNWFCLHHQITIEKWIIGSQPIGLHFPEMLGDLKKN
jgi:hypothetical protein